MIPSETCRRLFHINLKSIPIFLFRERYRLFSSSEYSLVWYPFAVVSFSKFYYLQTFQLHFSYILSAEGHVDLITTKSKIHNHPFHSMK